RPRAAGLHVSARARAHDPRRRPYSRARGSRGLAAVPDARGAHSRRLRDPADARAREVEARRARPAPRGRPARGFALRSAVRARTVPDLVCTDGTFEPLIGGVAA